jgi:phage terminase large subunit-like protein
MTTAAPTQERLPLQLLPKQAQIIYSRKRRLAFTGGRGSSKSVTGAIYVCLHSRQGGVYFIIAPTYTMLDGTIRTFKEVALKLGLWNHKAFWESKPQRAILNNGAEILFRSGDDADGLRGGDKAGAWLDEMQESDEDVYRVVEPALRQWGITGWIVATFTPGDPQHWTSKTFINPVNPEDVEFVRASLKENIFAPPDLYETLLRSWSASPLRIRRELEGECVYLEGAEWLPEYFDGIGFEQWPKTDRDEGIRVIALDPSKGKGDKEGDYSAFVLLWFYNGTLFVDADMRNDRGDIEITHTGVQLFKQFNPHYFVIESEARQNEHLVRDMHRIADSESLVMPITTVDSRVFSGDGKMKMDKKSRIRQLAGYVSERWFRFKTPSPGAKLLKEQLMAFPLGHDDGPDALAYGIAMLQKATRGCVSPPTCYNTTAMGQFNTPSGSIA